MSKKIIVIDCSTVDSEQAFWAEYVRAIGPDDARFFGRNLDAFWDAVSGGGPGYPEESNLHFTNTGNIKIIRGGAFYQALKKIADECTSIKIMID